MNKEISAADIGPLLITKHKPESSHAYGESPCYGYRATNPSPQTVKKFSQFGFTAEQQSAIKNILFLKWKTLKGVRDWNRYTQKC